jgi:hypothetical protein
VKRLRRQFFLASTVGDATAKITVEFTASHQTPEKWMHEAEGRLDEMLCDMERVRAVALALHGRKI